MRNVEVRIVDGIDSLTTPINAISAQPINFDGDMVANSASK